MRRIIRKFAQNNQANKHTNKQTEISNTEATLIPCGSSGGAGQKEHKNKFKIQESKKFLGLTIFYFSLLLIIMTKFVTIVIIKSLTDKI